ncbi:MAG: VCBS repeat-containing protein [Bacteroidota bacterium]
MKLRLLLVLAAIPFLYSCQSKQELFTQLPASQTGIDFVNQITESDSVNILVNEYIYNGGGIAIADYNLDGKADLYFTSSMVPNRLYLNQGDLQFQDVTETAAVGAKNKWCAGVATADINADGRPDLYVCVTNWDDPIARKNLLYINQGNGADGLPRFTEMAEAYGIADTSHTTNAAFFDYDNDGDLDLFLAINRIDQNPNVFREKVLDGSSGRSDRLYRNEGIGSNGHPHFTDVSREAGILAEGFSLGLNITDINHDGWRDIYVSNDYLSNDLLYLNQQDGTFKDVAAEYFKHSSHSAMGNDVVDFNNDGQLDFVAVEMLPEDNYRKKTMMMANNYMSYINNERYDYYFQYVRNTLQINQGNTPGSQTPAFSEVAMLAGIPATDWSWTPLAADFDHDGWRDLIITNGFPKDVTDQDFLDYHADNYRYSPMKDLLAKIPSVKIRNYAFRNTGYGQFDNVTADWGIHEISFSNGAAYADLDQDGDLDYVVNNINDPAFVFRNNLIEQKRPDANWLRIKLVGAKDNPTAIGSRMFLHVSDDHKLYAEHSPYRGYLSSHEQITHFGLGKHDTVRALTIFWPNGRETRLADVPANQVLTLNLSESVPPLPMPLTEPGSTVFHPVKIDGLEHVHQERDFIDFNVQPLLPHKLSQYGPGMAVGDIDGNGLEDVIISGSHSYFPHILFQQENGSFLSEELPTKSSRQEGLGMLLFDADNDQDLDLYLVNGSYEESAESNTYQDQLFVNEDGRLLPAENALPDFVSSGSCVRAADFDQDGDLDLFVGGRVVPHAWPMPTTSYLLRNDSKNGQIAFRLANEISAPALNNIGMVSDALWTDFDDDGWMDLILAGEWMPLQFLKNNGGKLENVTDKSGLANQTAWWTSLAAGDFDNDGDTDYLAGNMGLNTAYQPTASHPLKVYAKDFDNNGTFDAVPSVWYPDREGDLQEYPAFVRRDVEKQILFVKKLFPLHADFAGASMDQILDAKMREGAFIFEANTPQSMYIENLGQGKFVSSPLPLEAQVAPIYGMEVLDVNGDEYLDVLLVGNDHGLETTQGKCDAFQGLLLTGTMNGFTAVPLQESGFYVPGDAKSLVRLFAGEKELLLAGQNQDSLKVFSRMIDESNSFKPANHETRREIQLTSGKKRKVEFYHGQSFLGQSSRRFMLPKGATIGYSEKNPQSVSVFVK